jgi:hypothetical protein
MLDLIKNPTFWTTTALLAPLAVNLDPADFEELQTTRNRSGESSTTTIIVGGGAGTHGTGVEVLLGTITEGGGYGCDAPPATTHDVTTTLDFEEDFIDVGGEIDFRPAGKPLHIGVRGGYIWEQATYVGEPPVNPFNGEVVEVPPGVELTNQYGYVNPYFAVESENIGIGFGVIVSEQPLRTDNARKFPLEKNQATQPSFHLRFGNLEKIYFNYSLWENVPVYSGGGAHNVGMGLQLGKLVGVWGGLSSGGPYRSDAALFRATVGSFSPAAVNVSARVPMEYKGHDGVTLIEETSVSMSLRFRFDGDN